MELTRISCVYNEVTHFKGSSFYQTTSKNSRSSGISYLRLDHHDRYRAVWYMAPVFLDANQMFSYFPWNEWDTYKAEKCDKLTHFLRMFYLIKKP